MAAFGSFIALLAALIVQAMTADGAGEGGFGPILVYGIILLVLGIGTLVYWLIGRVKPITKNM